MTGLAKRWIAVGALLAAAGVALGAYGAHGLAGLLGGWGYAGDDLARRLANYDTAARYQMLQAVGLILTGMLLQARPSRWWSVAAWAMLLGVLVFSGLLYALALADPTWRVLGRMVPLGGAAMIAGWALVAVGALRD